MTETRHDALWRRVEAHLDARTDPFQDAAFARELRAVPEAEVAARRVMARLGALRGMGSSVATDDSTRATSAARTLRTAPSGARARSRSSRRFAAVAACVAASAALVALVRDTHAPRANPSSGEPSFAEPASESLASSTFDARSELGIVYSAHVEREHYTPPPPRAALVIHEPRHVFGWSLAENPR